MTSNRSSSNSPTFFLTRNLELAIAFLALACIAAHLIIRFTTLDFPGFQEVPLWIALIAGGGPLVLDLIRKALKGEFGADFLAAVSIVTAVFLNELLAGSIVVLMLSGGAALENYALNRASHVLSALAKRMPQSAFKRIGPTLKEIPVEDIEVSDLIVVRPHDISPVDGVVVEGHGHIDESFLTGEPFRISKAPGSEVISGTINGESALVVRATKRANDSRYAKIMNLMQNIHERRPRIRRIADRLGAWYTPASLLLAGLAWIFSGDPDRFLSVIVIATPCPLLIAIPVAIIGAVSLGASRGILIKDPRVLEQLQTCETIIFDKTGTLTTGIPVLTNIDIYSSLSEEQSLQLVASLEQYSRHPLAKPLLNEASRQSLELLEASSVSEHPGSGLSGEIKGEKILVTSVSKARKSNIKGLEKLSTASGGLECILTASGNLVARFRFRDEARADTKSFLKHLAPRHNLHKAILLSGDRESEVRYVAERVGISDVYAEKSPEEKVEIVRNETNKARTVYVGDGVNDAPALLAATVGIAFGHQSDVTSEAADAVILDASLARVDELFHIAERARRIALESAIGGISLSVIGMLLATQGFITPVVGAIGQEVIDLVAVLNALRVAFPPNRFSDLG